MLLRNHLPCRIGNNPSIPSCPQRYFYYVSLAYAVYNMDQTTKTLLQAAESIGNGPVWK